MNTQSTPPNEPPKPATKPAPKPAAKRSKTDSWPKQIRDENCRFPVTVYRRVRPSGAVGFQVANYSDGSRVLEGFGDETDAIERAKDLSRLLSNRQSLAGQLSNEDAVTFNAARDVLGDLPFLPTVQTAVEAVKLAGGLSNVLKACAQFAKRHGVNVTPKPVTDAVREFVQERKDNGCGIRYVKDLNDRLGRFAGSFKCSVTSVTGDQIQTWIDKLKIGPQSKVNYQRVLSGFFGFCERRGYLPKVWDELEKLAPVKVRRKGKVAIFSPKELRLLLAAAAPEFLPALVIQAFCGLRSAETLRLRWESVNLVEGHVTVDEEVSKTASRRIVPLCTAARKWLIQSRSAGKVWKRGEQAFYKVQQDTAAKAGIKWKHNAPRHAWISYRLAETADAARTAFEAGNSAAVVHRHYKELVTAKDAAKWFAAKPDRIENVTPFTLAVNA